MMWLQNIAFKNVVCRNITGFHFLIRAMRILALNRIIEIIGDREKLCIDADYAMQREEYLIKKVRIHIAIMRNSDKKIFFAFPDCNVLSLINEHY